MAHVRHGGREIKAQPIGQFANGDWIMRSMSQGPRFGIGDTIRVRPDEVIEIAAAEMPEGVQAAPLPIIQKVRDTEMAAGNKLAEAVSLMRDIEKEIDKEGQRAIDRLQAARQKARDGLGKFHGHIDAIDKGVKDVEDVANQLSNFNPDT